MATTTPSNEAIELEAQGDTGLEEGAPPEDTNIKRADISRIATAGFSFFVAGVHDGSLGALIPYITRTYQISTGSIAIIYGTTFSGWLIAFLTNSLLMQYLSFGTMLILGATLQLVSHMLRIWLVPFPVFAIAFMFASLGQAYQDTHANTFVAGIKTAAHRWLGLIHACYAGGLLVGPFVATGVASAPQNRWWLFYSFPAFLSLANLVVTAIAFKPFIGIRLRGRWIGPWTAASKEPMNVSETKTSVKVALKDMQKTMSSRTTWIISIFFLFYLGSVITASGWIVEYLVVVRGGDLAEMGYVPAGFNGGAFLGRLLLTEPTQRLGERWTVLSYCIICIGLQLVFWLVPNIIAASVVVSMMGFFLGPFFAAGVSVASRLFADDVKSSALSFVFVLGQVGGSVFPAMTGLIAAKAGVQVLQPTLLGLLSATACTWMLVPRKTVAHRE
ncbi:major facilitator superfamily domain-containing protein [Elsinoe ampelina]|uniref:Major facilitator superfamily domain-containing protein n=1 Tax=Elsinoe ampelina TaxID=302913 RepID=A0A6A6G016_9PEZI|nr:major facilitator superfamily domain-containing protein [Elsinoe ampelina]